LTSEPLLAADVAAFFNLLTGTSDPPEWLRLTIAPTGLRARFLELIEREISLSTLAQPGFIRAKMNSLQDEEICRALYRASQAGVQIHLNVRGICCLRPGVPGVSETIEVRSLIDRFLEHARIYGFRNGGHEQVFLSSADWMTRNLDHRLELLFPVVDEEARRRLWRVLELMMTDNTHAYVLRPGGRYERVPAGRPRVRAQEELYADAVRRAQERALAPERFRPLTAPADGE
jgi:polyphosphate kinase